MNPNSFKVLVLVHTGFGIFFEMRQSVEFCLIAIGGRLVECTVSKYLELSNSLAESECKELKILAKGSKFAPNYVI